MSRCRRGAGSDPRPACLPWRPLGFVHRGLDALLEHRRRRSGPPPASTCSSLRPHVTFSVPFIPAWACPETVHLKETEPFLSVTFSVADLPGRMSFVFFPPMLKSCGILPLLETVNVTEPAFTLFFDSVNLYSLGLPADTLTDVAATAGNAH